MRVHVLLNAGAGRRETAGAAIEDAFAATGASIDLVVKVCCGGHKGRSQPAYQPHAKRER